MRWQRCWICGPSDEGLRNSSRSSKLQRVFEILLVREPKVQLTITPGVNNDCNFREFMVLANVVGRAGSVSAGGQVVGRQRRFRSPVLGCTEPDVWIEVLIGNR